MWNNSLSGRSAPFTRQRAPAARSTLPPVWRSAICDPNGAPSHTNSSAERLEPYATVHYLRTPQSTNRCSPTNDLGNALRILEPRLRRANNSAMDSGLRRRSSHYRLKVSGYPSRMPKWRQDSLKSLNAGPNEAGLSQGGRDRDGRRRAHAPELQQISDIASITTGVIAAVTNAGAARRRRGTRRRERLRGVPDRCELVRLRDLDVRAPRSLGARLAGHARPDRRERLQPAAPAVLQPGAG